MKASQMWFWTGRTYHAGIKVDDELVVDLLDGEIWYVDEIKSQAALDEAEPFLAPRENGEWVELS